MSSVETLLGMAPLEVGQRVRVRQGGEGGARRPIEDGLSGVVALAFEQGRRYESPPLIEFDHTPSLCAANGCTPRRRLTHARFYSRWELERIGPK